MVPGRLPLVGHLPRIHVDVLKLVREAAQRFGPVFCLDHGFGARVVYLYGDDAFALLRNEQLASSPNYDLAPLVVENSLIPEDGPNHRRMRRAIDVPFSLKGLEAANVGTIIHSVISARLSTWEGKREIVISREAGEVALSVLFRIIGIEDAAIAQWRARYRDFAAGAINIPLEFPGSPAWRSKRAIAWMNEQLMAMVDHCRRRGDRQSFLGAMVHGEDDDGHHLSDVEILGNLRLLGFAGYETTASVMTWMMLHVAEQPVLWERLREEALAASGPPMGPADFVRFPFTEGLFREALRLHPPGWFLPRRATEDFEYRGITIPKGSLVAIPLISLSRSLERYSDPDCFNPDRWLTKGHVRHPLETCQFGGGPHFCLGHRLALLEGVQFIVSAARRIANEKGRPVLHGPLPKPRYLPFTHAPSRAKIHVVSA